MHTLIRWGGIVTVAGGGIALAGASVLGHVATGWWIWWAFCVLATVAGHAVVRHAEHRP